MKYLLIAWAALVLIYGWKGIWTTPGIYKVFRRNIPANRKVLRLMVPLFMPLWWQFVAVMRMKNKEAHAVIFYPSLVIGAITDVLTNVIARIFFGDLWTNEWMLTQRFKRYKKDEPFSWRGIIAKTICGEYLNKYDKGHC